MRTLCPVLDRHFVIVLVGLSARWSRYRRVEGVVDTRREVEVEAVPRHEAVDRLVEVEELGEMRLVSEKASKRPGSLDTDPVDDAVHLVEKAAAVGEQ